MTAVRMMFLLDTPNVWRGEALAGTPARVLALAEHSHRAGAAVTLVLCDRGAEYGTAADWPCDVLLVHPSDFYAPVALAQALEPLGTDFLLLCEAEALANIGSELARLLDARLVYDVHDDEAAVAASLGEPAEVVGRYEASQQTALRTADYVIVSTRHEAEMAAVAEVPSVRTSLLPNGADPDQRTCWGPDTDAATLVFVGNLYYQPNALAVTTIRDMILPVLRANGIDARGRVIGRGPAALTQPGKGIEFTGRVDTIDDALSGATLALAPLTAGSGAKMKVLDYMAAGLPVVGTSEAVTGLPLGHSGVVVNNDLRAWPSLLAALLRDPTALREIGHGGRACIERELSWQRIGTELVRQAHTWRTTPPPVTRIQAVPEDTRVPRWLADHATQGALGDPQTTRPGHPRWLRHGPDATCPTGLSHEEANERPTA
jgi:glycosyltransferase involved in cell wall biosynthesis